MYTSLAVANPQSLRLIQKCLSLENKLDCHGATDLALKANNNPHYRLSTALSYFEHFISCHTPFVSPEFIVEFTVELLV